MKWSLSHFLSSQLQLLLPLQRSLHSLQLGLPALRAISFMHFQQQASYFEVQRLSSRPSYQGEAAPSSGHRAFLLVCVVQVQRGNSLLTEVLQAHVE